jgi:hypothetical protein
MHFGGSVGNEQIFLITYRTRFQISKQMISFAGDLSEPGSNMVTWYELNLRLVANGGDHRSASLVALKSMLASSITISCHLDPSMPAFETLDESILPFFIEIIFRVL